MDNQQYISDLRGKCKTKSDTEFVDAIENIVTHFEKPREQHINLFIPRGGQFEKDWNEAIKSLIETSPYENTSWRRSITGKAIPYDAIIKSSFAKKP